MLDTDIGGDIDDAFSLALVLASPELNLRAVATVSGDRQARALIVAKLLRQAGRQNVGAGAPGRRRETLREYRGLDREVLGRYSRFGSK